MTNNSIENTIIRVAIVNYPGVMQSASHGLHEMLLLANDISGERLIHKHFVVTQINPTIELDNTTSEFELILIPPDIDGDYYLSPDLQLLNWILRQHNHGAVICSACAGAFIVAECGLLKNRPATTHWKLASQFTQRYPDVKMDANKILINDADIITAAGLMSWLDLGLEIVAQFMQPNIMRQLGKTLVVDTARREQRYYQSFVPILNHGDKAIIKAQHYLQEHFSDAITITILSSISVLGTRTFLRRFVKATGLKPSHYLQKLRIQKACDLIETTTDTFELISLNVGYQDTSAFRKIFLKIVGLSPRNFKNRFSIN